MSKVHTSTFESVGTGALGGRRATLTFARHYMEMVVAMVLGMLLLDPPLDGALELLGARPDTWRDSAPELSVLAMGVTMTVPMVAWMRVRGHRWRPTIEMSAAMLVPTAAAMASLVAGATSDL